jgi:hypothetical protein
LKKSLELVGELVLIDVFLVRVSFEVAKQENRTDLFAAGMGAACLPLNFFGEVYVSSAKARSFFLSYSE